MLEAIIWESEVGGEVLYHARVVYGGRRAFRIEDQPSEMSACLGVLEWAQRLGKREQLKWSYKNMKTTKTTDRQRPNLGMAPRQSDATAAVLSMPKDDYLPTPAGWTEDMEIDFKRCMDSLQKNRQAALEYAMTLAEIGEKELWRKTHGSFDAFVKAEGLSASYAYRQIKWAKNCQDLLLAPAGDMSDAPPHYVLPTSESQARPLSRLEAADKAKAWGAATERAAGGPVTAKIVEEEVSKIQPPARKTEPEQAGMDEMVLEAIVGTSPGAAVSITSLLMGHAWDRRQAEVVYDALIDRGLVENGRWVEKPKVEQGAEARLGQVLTERFDHALGAATITVMRAPDGWKWAWGYSYAVGSKQYRAPKFAAMDLPEASRQDAERTAYTELRKSALVIARGPTIVVKQKQVAKMMAQWCNTRLRILGDGFGGTENSGEPSKGVENNRREAESAEDQEEFALAGESAAERTPPQMSRERAGAIINAAKEGIAWLGNVEEGIKQLPVADRLQFGQAQYFMDVARKEFERIVRETGPVGVAAPKSKPQRREEHIEKGQRQGEKPHGKWQMANGKKEKEAVDSNWFVICRMPLKGSQTCKQPRFATNGGWGNDPTKAVKYNDAALARKEGLTGSARGDKVVRLDKAIGLAQKAKGKR